MSNSESKNGLAKTRIKRMYLNKITLLVVFTKSVAIILICKKYQYTTNTNFSTLIEKNTQFIL
jgi:hypothetical protein